MVSMLSVKEAMPMSRSERRSLPTRPTSQRKENGASASVWPRSARSRMASPPHTSVSRISSTGTGASAVGPRGSLRKTTLCSRLTPVSRPAVPSVNSSTTGPVLLKCIRWRQRSRTARDHMPEFCAQAESEAAEGSVSPTVMRILGRVQLDAVITAGHDHGEQARMDGELARAAELARSAGIRTAAAGACLGRNRGRRLAVLPGGAGDRSVSYIHEQSLSEAFQTASMLRPDPCLYCVQTRTGHRSCAFSQDNPAAARLGHNFWWPMVHEREYAPPGEAISTYSLASPPAGRGRRWPSGAWRRHGAASRCSGASCLSGNSCIRWTCLRFGYPPAVADSP